ncbi:MAG: SDR family oxidoreductase [Chloroflexi bacterium]|nr:SDR family oxidoreductase [Chloroflexota bacterium]
MDLRRRMVLFFSSTTISTSLNCDNGLSRYYNTTEIYCDHVEDVAHTVLLLASDESAYITGQTICVDGGMFIMWGVFYVSLTFDWLSKNSKR